MPFGSGSLYLTATSYLSVQVHQCIVALISDFLKWKRTVETETTSTFVRYRKDSNTSGYIRRSYYCRRSGRQRSRGQGIRHTRMQGSCKIGAVCPAAIFIRISPTGKPKFATAIRFQLPVKLTVKCIHTIYLLSVGPVLRWGQKYYMGFVWNLILFTTVQTTWKSIICIPAALAPIEQTWHATALLLMARF